MTISPEFEIQAFTVATLKASPTLMALIDGVYDVPPPNPFGAKQAYVSLGPTDTVIDDADCVDGWLHTLQIDVWSRSVGMPACKKIMTEVKRALHANSAELNENGLSEIRLSLMRTMRDPDGQTNHGVMQFEFAVEDLTDA